MLELRIDGGRAGEIDHAMQSGQAISPASAEGWSIEELLLITACARFHSSFMRRMGRDMGTAEAREHFRTHDQVELGVAESLVYDRLFQDEHHRVLSGQDFHVQINGSDVFEIQ